jgi:suppressor of G2 allele of SKP1
MEHAERGAAALDKGDAAGALVHYTRALIERPTSPDYYIQRSKAFARLSPPRHDLALRDAEYAVLYAQARGSRPKMEEAQLRRLPGLYNLGKYNMVEELIKLGAKWENNKSLTIWQAKLDQKLRSLPAEGRADDHEALEEIPTTPVPSNTLSVKLLKQQINADGTYNFDAPAEVVVEEQNDTPVENSVASPPRPSEPIAPVTIRQDWFQTGTTVTISLFAKGIDASKFEAIIEENSLSVSFPNPGQPSSVYQLSIDPLFAPIDTAKSTSKVMKTKAEVVLHKVTKNLKWKALENDGTSSADNNPASQSDAKETPPQVAPAYPTSAKTGPKNWDKLVHDMTLKKREKDVSTEPGEKRPEDDIDYDYESGDEVDNFFKLLYKGADPDTQRAMMKSYTESHGTTLSTNWDDVSQGPVKPYESKD